MPDIISEVNSAEEGSDIHGVLNRIAYRFHSNSPENPPEENWRLARDKLSSYIHDKWDIQYAEPVKDRAANLLHYHSHRFSTGNQVEDWNGAQNLLAGDVFNYN